MAQPIRVTVELEIPGDDPWDYTREKGFGEISQGVKVFHSGKDIGTATLRVRLENVQELGKFTMAGVDVLRARGLI